jgi:hypothetical protein
MGDVSGYKRWVAVNEFVGRTRNGVNIGREVFRDKVTGEVHDPGPEGWNGVTPTIAGYTPASMGGSEELWASAKTWSKEHSIGVVKSEQPGRTIYVYE